MYGYAELRKSQLPFRSWEKVRRAVGREGPGGMGKGRPWSIALACAEDLELNPTGDEMALHHWEAYSAGNQDQHPPIPQIQSTTPSSYL